MLYKVDHQKSISDKKTVKCIRSTKCSYILAKDSRIRCHECQGFLRSRRHLLKQPRHERTKSSTTHDSHANRSTLTLAELIIGAKKLHEMVAQTQKRARRCYLLYHREKPKKVEAPKNYSPTSFELRKLMDIALQNQWITENSVLYALLTYTLTSLKR